MARTKPSKQLAQAEIDRFMAAAEELEAVALEVR